MRMRVIVTRGRLRRRSRANREGGITIERAISNHQKGGKRLRLIELDLGLTKP